MAANPKLTLSLGGVDFCLVPSDAQGKVQFGQNSTSSSQEIALDLTMFTGRLLVTPSQVMLATEGKANNAIKVTPKFANNSMNGQKKRHLESTHITSSPPARSSRPLLQQLLQQGDDGDDDLHLPQDSCFTNDNSQSLTPNNNKKLKTAEEETRPTTSLAVDEDDEDDNNHASQSQTQDTLLAQMELSQTQPSFIMSQTQPSNDEVDHAMIDESAMPVQKGPSCNDCNLSHGNIDPSTSSSTIAPVARPGEKMKNAQPTETGKEDITKLSKKPTKQNKPKEKVAKKNTNKTSSSDSSVSSSTSSQTKTGNKVIPRVSIGTPEKDMPKVVHPAPSARWGHTVTAINNGRFLVYGGQGYHPTTRLPHTLNDLHVYDTNKKTWFKPFSGEGAPLQWHTATYLPDRQLLLAFGGESMHPKSGKVRTHSKVTVLDTELMVWYPPTVSGEVPSGRSGHAAAMVGQDLVVFGGVKGSKWLNTVSILNTKNWVWRQVKIQGSAPKPRSYHSATKVGSNKIVIFGGNDAEQSFATVHVLEKVQSDDGEVWQWTHPMVTGYGPTPRTGHSAVLLSDGKSVYIHGGWDPNDDVAKDDEALIFNDAFLLDTETWQWQKMSSSQAKRVGHKAVLLSQCDDTSTQILTFGGRIPNDQFTDEIEVIH
eukprot:scaffold353_cov185-Amphora_coffeaeformis.AAC.78